MAKDRAVIWLLVSAMVVLEVAVSVDAISGEIVNAVCGQTLYKDVCVDNLKDAGNVTDPKQIMQLTFKMAKDQVVRGIQESKTIQEAKNDPDTAEALEICREVMEYSANDLERVVDSAPAFDMNNVDAFIEDIKVWIGGAITYQDVCFEAFESTKSLAGQKIHHFFKTSRELSSNALTVVSDLKDFLKSPQLESFKNGLNEILGRHLAERKRTHWWTAGKPLPEWVNNPRRKVMNVPVNQIKPDAVVAQDGSGQYKTLGEALAKAPEMSMEPYIIYIKAGVYKESNRVRKQVWNVILVGDGPDKTIITGEKCSAKNFKTFRTPTFSVDGEGFMARDIKFENTAGPEGRQAVAIRVASDYAIFHNCKFEGAQNTLYSLRGRQFYRDCTITGTIDIIFGDAQAVYQNCQIMIKKPLLDQDCEVTAQARVEPLGPGAFVIQGSRIFPTEEYKTFKNTPGKSAYLGRPWREQSRTVVMNSFIDGSINPAGWNEWPAAPNNIKTAYLGEFENQGPGADLAKRVKWPSLKKLNPQEAEGFTPQKLFFNPNAWIPNSGVPFAPGRFSV